MKHRASGSFDAKTQPLPGDGLPRLSLNKNFHGDLEGTSAGDMMYFYSQVEGSGAYAAIETFTGSLHGRKGSFTLVHSGTMRRGGEYSMIVRVVPDSGTGELEGLSGTLEAVIEGANHSYHLDYELP